MLMVARTRAGGNAVQAPVARAADPVGVRGLRGGHRLGDSAIDATMFQCSRTWNGYDICVPQTAAAQQGVLRLQRAVDGFINQVPIMHLSLEQMGALDRLVDNRGQPIQLQDFPENPILSKATAAFGYDGRVGPDTRGWAVQALTIASALMDPTPAVLAALNSPVALTLSMYADALAAYLEEVTANFPSLLDRYKQDPRPLPALVPAPEPAPPVVEKTRKNLIGLGIGAAALIVISAVVFVKKGEDKGRTSTMRVSP